MSNQIRGAVFVLDDNIDTDQIIPAEYLTLVPSQPEEYRKLGSYALVGLPHRYGRFIAPCEMKTLYPITLWLGKTLAAVLQKNMHQLLWELLVSRQWLHNPMPGFFSATVLQLANFTRRSQLRGYANSLKLVKTSR